MNRELKATLLLAFLLTMSSMAFAGSDAAQDSVDLTATYDGGAVHISGTAPSWATSMRFYVYDENSVQVSTGYAVVNNSAFSVNISCFLEESGTLTAVAKGAGSTSVTTRWAIEFPSHVIEVSSVTLSRSSLSLHVSDTFALSATVRPSNATHPEVTWSSSSAAVSVDQGGNLVAVSLGTAVITASAGGKTASCVVEVLPDATFTFLLRMDYCAEDADYGDSGLDAASLREGITLTSQGHDAGEALEKVLNENGVPCSFWSGESESGSMKYWVDSILGVGDFHYSNGNWRYWIQYHDGVYNNMTLGYYTDGGQFSLIYGLTDVDGNVIEPVSVPSAIGGLVYNGSAQAGVEQSACYTVNGGVATNAGSYSASVVLNPGYAWSDSTFDNRAVSWSIAPAVLTASYVSETVSAGCSPSLQVSVTGFVNGETASTAAGYVAPTVSSPSLSPGSYVLVPSGGSARNYSFSYVPGTLTIGGSSSTAYVPSAATDLVYNGQYRVGVPSGAGYSISGNVAKDAGEYTATLSLYSGYAWPDGSHSVKTVSWTISRAVLTAAYVSETIAAGGSPSLEVSVTGFVNGETASTAAGYVAPSVSAGTLSPGIYTLVPSGGSARNYSFSYVPGTLTVTASDVPVDVPSAATGLVYNGQYRVGVPSGAGYSISSNVARDAGIYSARLSLDDGYVWADGSHSVKTVSWTISRAMLTAAYVIETVQAGSSPMLQVSVEGFVGGEGPSTASGYVAPAVSATSSSPGTYTLAPSGGSARNYSFTYVSGTLTITASDVPVNLPSAATGLVYNGQYRVGVPSGAGYSISGNVARDAGTYSARLSLDDGCVWADGSHSEKAVSWTILRAPLVASYVGEAISQGDSPSLRVSVTGFVNGETASTAAGYVAPSVSAGSLSPGTYTLVPSGGSARNYSFSYVPGTLTILPGASVGDSFVSFGLVYTVTSLSPREVSLTGYEDCPARLKVPSRVRYSDTSFAVTSIGEKAFYECSDVASVDAGGASVGLKAFSYCMSLEAVAVGSDIGGYAFFGCAALRDVEISEGVQSIGQSAFSGCIALESLSVASSVSSVGSNAFYGLTFYDGGTRIGASASDLSGHDFEGTGKALWKARLSAGDTFAIDGLVYTVASSNPWKASLSGYESAPSSLVVPEYVTCDGVRVQITSVGKEAFKNCSTITKADLGGVSEVGIKAFASCTNLKSVDVGENLKTLSAYAFYRCTKLSSINLEDSGKALRAIGSYAFYKCSALASIAVPSFVTTIGSATSFPGDMADEDGSLLAPTPDALNGYVYKKSGGVYVRQPGAEIGGEFQVGWLTYRVVSTLPAELEVVGHDGSFRNISIPESVEKGGVSYKVTAIGEEAFRGYAKIRSVSMPSVERIGSMAFYGCTYVVPTDTDNVASIGVKAFARCSGMGQISFGPSLKTISAYAFYGCKSLTSVDVPDSTTTIGSYAFYKCTGLSDVSLGASVKTIGSYAFACTSIQSIVLPSKVASIGANAFQMCSSLVFAEFEGASVTIGDGAFESCSLECVIMPATIKKLGSGAFQGLAFKSAAGSALPHAASRLSGKAFTGEGGVLWEL